jgi:diguanylate cyclase (GGDEF)-like protein
VCLAGRLLSSNISTSDGEFVIDDFDGYIGDICLSDTRHYLQSREQIIRIHPNPVVYHYDILVDFEHDSKKLLFFVSFNTNEITNLLKTAKIERHNILIINNQQNLIEITSTGSRDTILDRLDYRITEDEKSRILNTFPIHGTYWSVVDLRDNDLFKDYRYYMLKQGLIIYSFFIILTLLMSAALFVGIFRKNRLEIFLLEKNKKIEKLNIDLEHLSVTDGLTGLHNRRYLDMKGPQDLNTALRLNIPLNAALIDIDYFKQYNDTYGHQKGDECLIQITQLLSSFFRRSNDVSIRYGGEEFLVFNLGDKPSRFADQIQLFSDAIKSTDIKHSGSVISDAITVSIGISSTENIQCQTVYGLIQEADKALYIAKNSGRNKIQVSIASTSATATPDS